MNFDPKAVRRALMVAKDLASQIDPGFSVHNLPMPPQGVPLERAEGGAVDDHPDQGYSPKPAGVLDVDNPGGDWLKENREYSESRGYLPSGAPKSFGKVTAVWRKPEKLNEVAPVYLPVSMLAKLPGVMGEQGNVRENDLNWLVNHMGKTGKLPKTDGREYHPFITVDHRGMPFVSEGNHRIMAAAKLGWDYLPVEVRYFNGAENVDGPLHPDRLKAMHVPEKAEGGAVDDEMQARNLNPMGMYSAAAEAARNLPQERGTLQQMLATMKGVKPDELRWSGVQDKFAGQKTVTRDELAQHFEQRMPPLRENVRVESATEGPDARYGQYTLPGGQNYREVVMHMRPEDVEQTYPGEKMSYKSSHWQEPNVVAHLRLKDREFAPAKKPPKPDTQANIMMNTPLDPSGQALRPVDAWSTSTPGLVVTKSLESDEKGQYRVTHLGTGLNATGGNAYPFHQAMDAAKRLGEIWDGWTQDPDTVKAWAKDNGKLAREALKKASNPFGKKVLHIEELQSDWAQQGRDAGFRNAAALEKANAEMEKWRNEMSKAYTKSLDDRLVAGTPLQPFEKQEMLNGHYQDLTDLRNYFWKKGFRIAENPLENDEYGLFVTDKNNNPIDDEEFANKFDNSSALYDLDRMRGAYNAIQNFEKKSKEDPAFRKLKVGTYVAGLSPQKLAERLGQDAIEKTEALSKALAKGGGGHDEGPYVTNTNQWTDLGLKRALVEAARGGYDKLIWTPGEAQADRYKLNNFVDALRYKRFDDGYYHIAAEKNGRTVHADKYKPEELPGVVGQEIAKKIISGEGEPTRETEDSGKVIKGLDLNVGGRGMYEYYDKILPRRLMALAQEHDPEAQIKPLKGATGKIKNLPSLDITPRMRDSILKRGFKAFKRGGAVQGHLFHHHDEPKSIEVPVMDRERAIRRALMIAKDGVK